MPIVSIPSKFPVLTLIGVIFIGALTVSQAHAWDATGHRLTAYIAYEEMSDAQRDYWMRLLAAHPRFDEDFMQQMPAAVRNSPVAEQNRWLLGQAAYWPDIARGLPYEHLRRFNRPNWHWIDGAWIRDEAVIQGNVYVGMAPFPDVIGPTTETITQEHHADNVVTALEYAMYQLHHSSDDEERAVALCWVLHLIGDMHQPLHTGALVSPRLYPQGDRGGNETLANDSNLHAVWDNALRGPPLTITLQQLLSTTDEFRNDSHFDTAAPTRWLQESREILQARVYPENLIENVRQGETTGNRPERVTLDNNYENEMRDISRQRIVQAGLRIHATLSEIH
jgi:hypothetical protein